MCKNILVELLDTEGKVISSQEYRSLRQFNVVYPQIKYKQLRAVYLYYNDESVGKKLHPFNKNLIEKMRIKDINVNLDNILLNPITT